MNDHELLELAAKAAGYEFNSPNGSADISSDGRRAWVSPGFYWQPFDDDGDALRLAVRLGLIVNCWLDAKKTWAGLETDSDGVIERHGGDPYAATRRAIVRAAAEIGKAMP